MYRQKGPNHDYKSLWETNQQEIKRLQMVRRGHREAEADKRRLAEQALNEKNEKEDLVKKISHIEEQLQQSNNVKRDNERLKAENRALIRVVNKLNNMHEIIRT